MKLSGIKEFVTQPDGTIKAVPIQVTHALPNGGVVYSTEQHPIQANSVAIVEVCEIGEHCRCKSFDVAYKADCWNWIGKVTL